MDLIFARIPKDLARANYSLHVEIVERSFPCIFPQHLSIVRSRPRESSERDGEAFQVNARSRLSEITSALINRRGGGGGGIIRLATRDRLKIRDTPGTAERVRGAARREPRVSPLRARRVIVIARCSVSRTTRCKGMSNVAAEINTLHVGGLHALTGICHRHRLAPLVCIPRAEYTCPALNVISIQSGSHFPSARAAVRSCRWCLFRDFETNLRARRDETIREDVTRISSPTASTDRPNHGAIVQANRVSRTDDPSPRPPPSPPLTHATRVT
jgi:hypothetical protein